MAQSASQAGFMKGGASRRIYLIRHGVTDWNRELRYQGSSDIELNREGLEQARLLGLRLSQQLPGRVISSPLRRAYRTAEVIMGSNSSKAGIEKSEDIREVSFGIWEGLSVAEVDERDAETIEAWRRTPFSVVPEGGESLGGIMERASRVADMINSPDNLDEPAKPGGEVFVVAHGAILRALLGALLRIDDMNLLWRMRFDNCGVTIIEMWGRRPSLLLLNDTQHLRMTDERMIRDLSFPI